MRNNGETKTTRHYVTTRPADADELAIGMPVARVASVDPLDHGYVIVSGGYKVGVDGLRAVVGDDSPTTRVTGSEDEHFLRSDHYIITSRRVKDGGYSYVRVGAPIREPSEETRGEGHFIQLSDGDEYWTENAWRTRRATEDDIAIGTRVFMFNRNKGNDIYGPPGSREAALTKRWWTARVTDDSQLYKGVVQVSGNYAVSLDAIRVAY